MRGGQENRVWTAQIRLLAIAVNLLYTANQQRGGQNPTGDLITLPGSEKKPQTGRPTSSARTVTVADLLARRGAITKPKSTSQ